MTIQSTPTFSYRDLLIFLCAVIVFSLSACFVRGWILEREARVKAEANAAAKQKIVEAQQQVIDGAQDSIKARDQTSAQKDSTITALEVSLRNSKTPQQAIQIIHDQLPAPPAGQPAPAPIQVVDTDTLPPAVKAAFPDDPSLALLPVATLKSMADQMLVCEQTTNDAATCKADLADTHTVVVATQTQLAAEVSERNTWESAAKGGNKFHRFLGVVKQTACAAAGGGGGAAADKAHPATGAAIGSAAAVLICSAL